MTPPVVGVGGVLVRADRRVLLVRRGRPPGQGSWSLPGGKVRGGESLRDALVREMREETSLSVEVGALLDVVEIVREGFHYVVVDYLCTTTGGEGAAAGDDAAEVRWVDAQELAGMEVTTEVRRMVERALALVDGAG